MENLMLCGWPPQSVCDPEKGKVGHYSVFDGTTSTGEYQGSSIGVTLEAGYSTLPFHLIEFLTDIIRDLYAIMKDYPAPTLLSFPNFAFCKNSGIIFQH